MRGQLQGVLPIELGVVMVGELREFVTLCVVATVYKTS